jgi:arylsulfatase
MISKRAPAFRPLAAPEGNATKRFAAFCVLVIILSLSANRDAIAEEDTRPNVLFILADDMGFSDAGCYGGEINTPNIDRLARGGLQFTQHYSTGRCWPSRATLLTGYYPQQVQRDFVADIKRGQRPEWAKLLPDLLKPYGYKSYHSGKWHLDGKPTDNGFDRSWGSTEHHGAGDDRYFATPGWKEDDLERHVAEGEEYYSTIALVDHAIACLKLHEKNHKEQPFFQYLAFYSPHFPLHALQADIDKYRGVYRKGWDVAREERLQRMREKGLVNTGLSSREEGIVPRWNLSAEELQEKIGPGEAAQAVAWDTLTEKQKDYQATKMAIHAGMIARMDTEIGRVIKQLEKMDAYKNTLIFFASDNGASAEQIIRGDLHDKKVPLGSAGSYVCLGPGWSTAANTPFKLHKHWNHEGGISSPLVVHWPDGIKARGELRTDVSHFIDIAPTIVEVAGGAWPEETEAGVAVPRRPGISLVSTFGRNGSTQHENLWWYHQGNRALRRGDWKIAAKSESKDESGLWELYNLKIDRTEMRNLAEKYPEKVKELAAEWEKTVEGFRRDLKKS